ncbi:hypothetical protein [Aminobacter sp. BE322]|uniref:hypothetical protein n=1 Tax=unclassified Aminobacter TaxID=2644704 RepID=UPI003D19A8D6
MKIFSMLAGLVAGRVEAGGSDSERVLAWVRDPLAHPDIERMDERELADLPFNRGFRRSVPRVSEACSRC